MAEVITNTQKMTDAFAGVGTDALTDRSQEKIRSLTMRRSL